MDECRCEQGAASGKDFTGVTGTDWYFIGAKPPAPRQAAAKNTAPDSKPAMTVCSSHWRRP
jgi:hypothetical protein